MDTACSGNLHCLMALAEAQACHLPEADLRAILDAMAQEFGQPVVRAGDSFAGLTPAGERVLAWARRFHGECTDLRQELRAEAIAPLLQRRSVSPRRLQAPGPDPEAIGLMLQAALRAPDHGGLHPWRVIEFQHGERDALAECFVQEKLRRDPLAPADDLARARQHATQAPTLLAFVVAPQARSKTPVREQWLTAGAALGNLLNAAHQLGFGAIVLSGERCHDTRLMAQLGIRPHEFLAGFVSLGSLAEAPPPIPQAAPLQRWSRWLPGAPAPSPRVRDLAPPPHSHPD